jgi:hypothetical protein
MQDINTFTPLEISDIILNKEILKESLNKKLKQLPIDIIDIIVRHGILTGGSISSSFHNEAPNDYDIYLKDLDSLRQFKQLLTDDNLQHVKSANEKYMEVLVNDKMVTVNATTFVNDIQVITLGTVAMRETFDFVHCMPWIELYTNKLHISKKQYDLIKKKHLIKNPDYPHSLSDKRISKYVNKGWRFHHKNRLNVTKNQNYIHIMYNFDKFSGTNIFANLTP